MHEKLASGASTLRGLQREGTEGCTSQQLGRLLECEGRLLYFPLHLGEGGVGGVGDATRWGRGAEEPACVGGGVGWELVCVWVGGACEWSVVCKGLELDEKGQV